MSTVKVIDSTGRECAVAADGQRAMHAFLGCDRTFEGNFCPVEPGDGADADCSELLAGPAERAREVDAFDDVVEGDEDVAVGRVAHLQHAPGRLREHAARVAGWVLVDVDPAE